MAKLPYDYYTPVADINITPLEEIQLNWRSPQDIAYKGSLQDWEWLLAQDNIDFQHDYHICGFIIPSLINPAEKLEALLQSQYAYALLAPINGSTIYHQLASIQGITFENLAGMVEVLKRYNFDILQYDAENRLPSTVSTQTPQPFKHQHLFYRVEHQQMVQNLQNTQVQQQSDQQQLQHQSERIVQLEDQIYSMWEMIWGVMQHSNSVTRQVVNNSIYLSGPNLNRQKETASSSTQETPPQRRKGRPTKRTQEPQPQTEEHSLPEVPRTSRKRSTDDTTPTPSYVAQEEARRKRQKPNETPGEKPEETSETSHHHRRSSRRTTHTR